MEAIVPDWAQPMTFADFELFLELVANRFQGRARIDDGVVTVKEGSGDAVSYGLANVLGQCRQIEKSNWAALIEEHFANCERSLAEGDDEDFEDFEKIKEQIALRVMPAATVEEGNNDWYYRRGPDGTVVVLVIDLPSTIVTVQKELVAKWSAEEDFLFKKALENVKKKFPVVQERQQLPTGYELTVFHGEHFYVSTHILLLDEYPELVGPYGSLVGIPVRDLLVVFPINCFDGTVQAVNAMIPILASMWKDGPGSTSAELYWYNAGLFTPIPYKIKGADLDVLVPPSFKSLLELLVAIRERGVDG